MKIFLSWSGDRGRTVALALRAWLPCVFQDLTAFMSEKDIEKGEPWLERIEKELGGSDIGVLCLTPENLAEPWLLFEAGFLRKAATRGRVIPYLLDLKPADVEPPLGTLQACVATEAGTQELIETINRHRSTPLSDAVLLKQFAHYWPELGDRMEKIPEPKVRPEGRADRELLEEILSLVRHRVEPLRVHEVILHGEHGITFERFTQLVRQLGSGHRIFFRTADGGASCSFSAEDVALFASYRALYEDVIKMLGLRRREEKGEDPPPG